MYSHYQIRSQMTDYCCSCLSIAWQTQTIAIIKHQLFCLFKYKATDFCLTINRGGASFRLDSVTSNDYLNVTYFSITYTHTHKRNNCDHLKAELHKHNQTLTVTSKTDRLSLPILFVQKLKFKKLCILRINKHRTLRGAGVAWGTCCVFISCNRHLRTFPSVGVRTGWDAFSIQMERTLYFA